MLNYELQAAVIPNEGQATRDALAARETRSRNRLDLIALIRERVSHPDDWARTSSLPSGTEWVSCARDNPKTFEWRWVNGTRDAEVRLHKDLRGRM